MIQEVNRAPARNPQIIGERWGTPAFIFVRTALYPEKGELTEEEFLRGLSWAEAHQATAFFASVGLACTNYPDHTEVTVEEHMRLPIRHGGFAVA